MASFSLQWRWSGAARGRLLVAAHALFLVREEEEEGRWVPWQATSLRENIFPEIRLGCAWAKRADEGRQQPRKEWAGVVKKEEGGRWGQVVSVWAGR
jgi:hypothetical protein